MMMESEFDVVAAVEDGRALLNVVKTLKPDLVLLDISMPLLNGISAARQIRRSVPSAKIMFLTMHEDTAYVAEALRAGASGYLSKCAARPELLSATRQVLDGYIYISPLVTREPVGLLFNLWRSGNKPIDGLTSRQQEVLQLIAEGKSRKEIATVLHISVKTVEFHKAILARQLHLRSSADFTLYALEHGIISCHRARESTSVQ
jgi:DNA-binding NarL/FixJ family response regulator